MNQIPWSRTVPDLVREACAGSPHAEAIVAQNGARLTYAELERAMDRLAASFSSLGLGRDTSVALLAPNVIEWIPVALGVQLAGSRLAAFNTFVKPMELAHLLDHSECSVLVSADRVGRHSLIDVLRETLPELWSTSSGGFSSERFPALKSVFILGDDVPPAAIPFGWLLEKQEGTQSNERRVSAIDEAIVLYTSGSTALPKAVPLQHYGLVENGHAIGERMALSARDRVWLGSPLFWSYGVANAMMATFTHGATLVLQTEYAPQAAAELIARESCTAAYLLPTIIQDFYGLDAQARVALGTLETGLTIGRPEEFDMAVELGIGGICNVYGATEVYGNCCVTPREMPVERRRLCQGPPLPGVELRLVDPETRTLISGGRGAIEVRGYTTRGYLGSPDLNAETFTSDGWYHTGDLGEILDDNSIRFATRVTDMIKTSGINVSPAEVEAYISTLEGVAECVVVGAPDSIRDEVVVAYIRGEAGKELDTDDIIRQCRVNIAAFKVPARIYLVDAMPVTSTGKISRLELKKRAASSAGEA